MSVELEELLNDYDELKCIQKLKKDLAKYRFEKSYLLKEEKNQVKLLSIHSQCRLIHKFKISFFLFCFRRKYCKYWADQF